MANLEDGIKLGMTSAASAASFGVASGAVLGRTNGVAAQYRGVLVVSQAALKDNASGPPGVWATAGPRPHGRAGAARSPSNLLDVAAKRVTDTEPADVRLAQAIFDAH